MASLLLFNESQDINLSMDDAGALTNLLLTSDDSASSYASRVAWLRDAMDTAGQSSAVPAILARADSGLSQQQCELLVDGITEMWKERNRYQAEVLQSSNDLARMKSDLAHSQQRIVDLKEEVKEAERKGWETEMKRRTQEKEALAREKALKAQLVELEKKSIMIQRRDNQYKHELRKIEMEKEKIQEKLHKIILEKTTSTGSTFGGATDRSGMGSTQRLGAGGKEAAGGGWEMTNTLRPSAGGASKAPLPTSSADLELMQGTLATYSERLGQLISENQQLKASFKQFESHLQTVIDEEGGVGAAEAANSEPPQLDEHGVPIPRALVCLSPRSRQLLLDFTPQQLELPWELIGADVEAVLRAKVQLVQQKVKEQRLQKADQKAEQSLVDELALFKTRVAEQDQIICEQDALLQATLFADEKDRTLAKEQEEGRRLSARVEAEDWKRRRMMTTAGATTAATAATTVSASPSSLKILGGRSAANLPILATPIFTRKPSAVSTTATAAAAAASPSSSTKSKWLQGGVILSPTFTPSKRSRLRAGGEDQGEESNLSAVDGTLELDEEFDEDDADIQPVPLEMDESTSSN